MKLRCFLASNGIQLFRGSIQRVVEARQISSNTNMQHSIHGDKAEARLEEILTMLTTSVKV